MNKACTEEYDFTTEKVTDNLTLYAEWNQNGSGAQKCTVTFDWNYEGSQPETKEVEAGSFVTPPEEAVIHLPAFGIGIKGLEKILIFQKKR